MPLEGGNDNHSKAAHRPYVARMMRHEPGSPIQRALLKEHEYKPFLYALEELDTRLD